MSHTGIRRSWQGAIAALTLSLAYVFFDMISGKNNIIPKVYDTVFHISLIVVACGVGWLGGRIIEDAEKSRDKEKGLSRKLETLHAANIRITASMNQDEIFDIALDAVKSILGFSVCGIFLVENDMLHFKKSMGGMPKEAIFPLPLSGDRGITVLAAQERKTIHVPDVSSEPRYIEGAPSSRSEVALPIMCHDRVLGVLDVESFTDFGKEEIKTLEILASFAGCALEDIALFRRIGTTKERLEFLTDLVAHDVNNINTIAMGYLSLLLETPLSENQKKFVEKALSSIRRNTRLLGYARKIERVESEELESERIALMPIILECIENASASFKKEVDARCFSEEVYVWGGEFLSDVFLNLIDNAIKYSGEKARIEISLQHEDKSVIVRIKDWGRGIPDDTKENIFRRFESMKNDKGSRGLGLWLVSLILEKYKGQIWIEDNPEGGCIFCVRLPAS